MTNTTGKPSETSSSPRIDAFPRAAADTTNNARPFEQRRLNFAMDATTSREPAWTQASRIQAQMFEQTAALEDFDKRKGGGAARAIAHQLYRGHDKQ